MDKKFLQATLKAAGDKIEIVASDESLDRHGDKLPVEAWDLKNFKKNPVLLVDHQHKVENIVGRAANIRVEKAGTKRRLIFDAILHDLTEKGRAVKEMVANGFLKSVSVGFIWKQGFGEDGKTPVDIFELLEVSFVTVGANPNALILNGLTAKDVFAKTDELPAEEKAKVEAFGAVEAKDEIVEVAPAKKAVATIEEATEFLKGANLGDAVDCGIILLKTLLADSEKLKTLTQLAERENRKGRSIRKRRKDADVLDKGVKEAVGILMRTLQLSKKTKN